MRSLRRWSGLVGLALLLLMSLFGVAHAQGDGVLEGQVVNGTADGSQIGSGIPVTLHVLQGDSEVDTLATVTEAGGRFRFEGLDTEPGFDYWLEAVYLDVAYSTVEPYQFGDGQTALDATVTVYETTEEDSGITVDSVHIIAESFGQVLRISEIHLFGNSGDRTYVGGSEGEERATTLRIPLPDGAVGLAFGEGTADDRFVETVGAVLDTEPVPPGSETALAFFSYHLMVTGETIPLERRFAYPVNNLNLLAAQPGLALSSDQLLSMGAETFQGQQYEYYVGQGVGLDAPLIVEFVLSPDVSGGQDTAGMPVGSDPAALGASTRGNQGLLRWLGMGLAALVVVGAVAYALATKSSARVPASVPNLAADPKTRPMVAELADLEDAFEAGRVEAAAYERRRAELHSKLKSS